jgi:hypothetical protein
MTVWERTRTDLQAGVQRSDRRPRAHRPATVTMATGDRERSGRSVIVIVIVDSSIRED